MPLASYLNTLSEDKLISELKKMGYDFTKPESKKESEVKN